jgi:Cu/Ag efflux protein CusF
MKKYIVLMALAIGLALPAIADTKPAHNPGGAIVGSATVDATVQAIDYKTREVTLKKDNGEVLTLAVGPAAHNFDQVKVGDRVNFQYKEALVVDVQKANGELGHQAEMTLERAPKGQKPNGTITGTYTLKALVENIDYSTRHVTLKGPDGDTVTFKVGEQAKRFNEVKKGDQVVVQYTQALGISVTTPKG